MKQNRAKQKESWEEVPSRPQGWKPHPGTEQGPAFCFALFSIVQSDITKRTPNSRRDGFCKSKNSTLCLSKVLWNILFSSQRNCTYYIIITQEENVLRKRGDAPYVEHCHIPGVCMCVCAYKREQGHAQVCLYYWGFFRDVEFKESPSVPPFSPSFSPLLSSLTPSFPSWLFILEIEPMDSHMLDLRTLECDLKSKPLTFYLGY